MRELGTPILNARYEPDFVRNPERLLDQLVSTVAWDDRMRARKTACFGRPYNYSGLVYEPAPFPPEVAAIIVALDDRCGFRPNSCLLNYYPTGEATMGFHSDANADLAPGTGVAIVSLGAERAIVFRSRRQNGEERRLRLESGSLLLMAPEVQDDWKHAVLAAQGVGARISLTFRCLK